MTAKELAIQDIQKDLKKQGKCFIAFRTELDPIMRTLVHNQLDAQRITNPDPTIKGRSQLIATCLFCKDTGKAILNNYSHYYKTYEKKPLFK